MKQVIVLSGFFFIFFNCASATAEFFKYVDEKGEIRYTDNLDDVPPEQRSGVEIYNESAQQETAAPEGQTPEDEKRSDVSTGDEAAFERLKQTQAELDKEYQLLQNEIEALNKEREQLVNRAYNRRVHEEKVKKLNKRIDDYEKRRKAFEAETRRVTGEQEK